METIEKKINRTLVWWEKVNKAYKGFFSNKTQRKAQGQLLETYNEEMLEKMIKFIPKMKGILYAPTVYNPHMLWNKQEMFWEFLRRSKDWWKEWSIFTVVEARPNIRLIEMKNKLSNSKKIDVIEVDN